MSGVFQWPKNELWVSEAWLEPQLLRVTASLAWSWERTLLIQVPGQEKVRARKRLTLLGHLEGQKQQMCLVSPPPPLLEATVLKIITRASLIKCARGTELSAPHPFFLLLLTIILGCRDYYYYYYYYPHLANEESGALRDVKSSVT